jgi:HK97 family phage major capsid protein/HK97 family phage prohead protease
MPVSRRAYSLLHIKSVDDDKRIIFGTATTPETDIQDDVVEPKGAEFKLPIPFLWQHDSRQPIGHVTKAKVTSEGIDVEVRLQKTEEPGAVKDRLDSAWQDIKLGLVRGLSIGFVGKETARIEGTFGIHFLKWLWVELSAVTIAANQAASITAIKSIDTELLAASGRKQNDDEREPPGATGKRNSKSPAPKDAKTVKTIAEQIAAFEASRAAKDARMAEIMQKAAESGETLDDATSEEYDTLEAEVKKIDEHLTRLAAADKRNKEAAVRVEHVDTVERAADNRGGRVIQVRSPAPKGTAFTRYVMATVQAKGNRMEAREIAKQWHDSTPEVELALSVDVAPYLKAAISPGTSDGTTWAGPLVAYQVMASEFIELLRPATIIGRIPGLRRVPFNIQMPRTTTGSSVGWVGEQAPKPVSQMAFDTVTLRWAKAAGIIVLTEELVRFSNPSAEAVVRTDLINAMAQFLDRDFVDPSKAEFVNVSPASITNGVTPVSATGAAATNFRADVKTLFGLFYAANMSTVGGVWIMTQTQALALALMLNSLGQRVFPDITAEGGILLGYPVVTSENIPGTGSPADGFPIIFAKASEIMLADDGQVVIDASREASLQMDSAPDSPPTASSNMVSMFQMNMLALRAERWINWKKRRAAAVQYILGAKYSE